MNPSVQEIVDGVAATPTSSVIVLPNNKNIIPAAQQASELAEKNVVVVPTSTLPQGIAALLAFHPDLTAVENATAMQRASNEVRTGEICDAVRSVQLDGVTVKLGQKIGLFERKLLVAGDVTSEVLISLLSKSELDDCELLTLYWGGDLTEEDAEMASRKVRQTFPDIEVELVRGGQPHYHFIISLE